MVPFCCYYRCRSTCLCKLLDCSDVKVCGSKKSTSAEVTWDDPVAIDNVDTNVNVTKLTDLKKGSFVEYDDSTYVQYQAVDTAGNPSSLCTFALEVGGKRVHYCKLDLIHM